jgi:hypothetical protein
MDKMCVDDPAGEDLPPPLLNRIRKRGLTDVGLQAEFMEYLYLQIIEGAVEEFPAVKMPDSRIDRRRMLAARPAYRVADAARQIRWLQEHRHEKRFPDGRSTNGEPRLLSMVELIGEGFASSLIALLPSSRTFRNDVAALGKEARSVQSPQAHPAAKRKVLELKAELRRHLRSRPEGRPDQTRERMEEAQALGRELDAMDATEVDCWVTARLRLDPAAHRRVARKTLALYWVGVRHGEARPGEAGLGSMERFADHLRDSHRKQRGRVARIEREVSRSLRAPAAHRSTCMICGRSECECVAH